MEYSIEETFVAFLLRIVLQILVTHFFCLRTRSIFLRLLISENQISLRDSRISQNQPDLVLFLVGRSIDRVRGSYLTYTLSQSKFVLHCVLLSGEMAHSSMDHVDLLRRIESGLGLGAHN
jgi:hypothetical protein